MAWPCISRVCCLARFWNQLDKSDLAVPLTLHNYSDIEEPSEEGPEGAQQQQQQQQQQPRVPTGGGSSSSASRPQQPPPRAAPALPGSASAPSLQESLGGARRPSRKGSRRLEPFSAETQYRQDYRAWPVQKRDVLPWIGESRRAEPPGAPPAAAATPGGAHVYVLPTAGREEVGGRDGGFKQVWCSSSPPGVPRTSSYRHEYRPWTGAKRSRPTKIKHGFIIPEESSYKTGFKIPEVKAKFSPNPSAVFQAPTRILNV